MWVGGQDACGIAWRGGGPTEHVWLKFTQAAGIHAAPVIQIRHGPSHLELRHSRDGLGITIHRLQRIAGNRLCHACREVAPVGAAVLAGADGAEAQVALGDLLLAGPCIQPFNSYQRRSSSGCNAMQPGRPPFDMQLNTYDYDAWSMAGHAWYGMHAAHAGC